MDRARNYDRGNRHLAPLQENLRYLINIVLSDLPSQSRVLCVGVGTGSEIISLAEAFPGFGFVGVEPSGAMLEVCRERLQKLNLLHRCELVHGYVQDVAGQEEFDAALCLLVLHHASKDGSERRGIVSGIAARLKPLARLVSAEISYDRSAETFDEMMAYWKALSRKAGSPEEKIQALPRMMDEHLSVHSPAEAEEALLASGFEAPVRFFQSLLIHAWVSRKRRTDRPCW